MAEYDTMRAAAGVHAADIDQGLRAHMNKVYGTMALGMLITGAAAWALSGLAVSPDPTGAALQNGKYLTPLGVALYASPLQWVVMLAPIAFVWFFARRVHTLSAAAAQTLFYVFAAMMGASISSIFLIYTGESIIQTFLVTAIAFAGLSIYGYTTNRDLSAVGTFLIMGVIGLIAAMIVNLFLQSSGLGFAISALGVLIFAGMTAYDTQRIKSTYLQFASSGDQEWLGKAAIMGALSLYLDFINMFMFLLSFLGNRE